MSDAHAGSGVANCSDHTWWSWDSFPRLPMVLCPYNCFTGFFSQYANKWVVINIQDLCWTNQPWGLWGNPVHRSEAASILWLPRALSNQGSSRLSWISCKFSTVVLPFRSFLKGSTIYVSLQQRSKIWMAVWLCAGFCVCIHCYAVTHRTFNTERRCSPGVGGKECLPGDCFPWQAPIYASKIISGCTRRIICSKSTWMHSHLVQLCKVSITECT